MAWDEAHNKDKISSQRCLLLSASPITSGCSLILEQGQSKVDGEPKSNIKQRNAVESPVGLRNQKKKSDFHNIMQNPVMVLGYIYTHLYCTLTMKRLITTTMDLSADGRPQNSRHQLHQDQWQSLFLHLLSCLQLSMLLVYMCKFEHGAQFFMVMFPFHQ